jgi:hypothetical protein
MRFASSVIAMGCVSAVIAWLALPTGPAGALPVAVQPLLVIALPCDGGAGRQPRRRSLHIGAFAVHVHLSGGIGQPVGAGFALVLDPSRPRRPESNSAFVPRSERCKR